jgi:hypothetical protein
MGRLFTMVLGLFLGSSETDWGPIGTIARGFCVRKEIANEGICSGSDRPTNLPRSLPNALPQVELYLIGSA